MTIEVTIEKNISSVKRKYINSILDAIDAAISVTVYAMSKDDHIKADDIGDIIISAVSNAWSSNFIRILGVMCRENPESLREGRELLDKTINETRLQTHRKLEQYISAVSH